MGRRVGIGRDPQVVVPEDPTVPLPVELVLVARLGHLEPVLFGNGGNVEANRQPEIAAIPKGQWIVGSTPATQHEIRSPAGARGEAHATFGGKDGQAHQESGQLSEGLGCIRAPGLVRGRQTAGFREA